MILEISTTTLNILAWLKVLMFSSVLFSFYFIYKKKKAIWFIMLTALSFFLFYLILSFKFKSMFWGTVGDEMFISAFLTNVMHGNPLSDFYYQNLPVFYPPLYFWITGFIAKMFTSNAITAAKIGVLGTTIIWFLGSFFFQKLYWTKITIQKTKQKIINQPFFWLIFPLLFFLILDFDVFVLKPYEAISALFCLLWLIFWTREQTKPKWQLKQYLFFGITGGLLFLIYYFWWFILIPILILFTLIGKNKIIKIKNLFFTGIIIFLISSIYLIPLIISFIKNGIENWQAKFFIIQDFSTFVPWKTINLKNIFLLAGLFILIRFFKKNKTIKTVSILLIFCYLYQFTNTIFYLLGLPMGQPAKHFMILGTSCLVFGLTFGLIYFFKLIKNDNLKRYLPYFFTVLLFTISPFIFIDELLIVNQINKNQKNNTTESLFLSDYIKNNIENPKSKVWLSSGTPGINAYFPIKYFIAHNAHFSHQASLFSKRLNLIIDLTQSKNDQDFYHLTQNNKIQKIDALLFYNNSNNDNYTIHFLEDNFPNGGRESNYNIKKNLISEKYWIKKNIDSQGKWVIFLAK
jgi:hypothetical protein